MSEFIGTFLGEVTDNEDPKRRGRLKVRVPKVNEPESGWALPCGMGGGTLGRGRHSIPKVGSMVFVRYLEGDPDKPIWEYGPWLLESPDEEDTPDGATTDVVAGANAADVHGFESDVWRVAIDDAAQTMTLVHKPSGNHVTWEGSKHELNVRLHTIFRVDCDGLVDIRGTRITLNSRVVLPTGRPI